MRTVMTRHAPLAALMGCALLAACGQKEDAAGPGSQTASPVAAAPEVHIVAGTSGNETVTGSAAAERIMAGPGDDVLLGGGGADLFVVEPGFGHDWVSDFQFADGDRIEVPASATFMVGEYQGQLFLDFGNGDVLGFVGVPSSAYSDAWIVRKPA